MVAAALSLILILNRRTIKIVSLGCLGIREFPGIAIQFLLSNLKPLLSRIPLHLLFQILFNNAAVAGSDSPP